MAKELLIAFLLVLQIPMMGCNSSSDVGGTGQSVIDVVDDDAEMLAAIESAKASLGFFEQNWQAMESDGYSLKFALPTTDGGVEHIWFSPTKIQGDKITGVCANVPENIPGLKLGDTRTVSRDDVSDWMIVVGNKCYGGYTIRVLARRDPDLAPPLKFIDPSAN